MLRKKTLRVVGLWVVCIAALSLWIGSSHATEITGKTTEQPEAQCVGVVINEYMSARQRVITDVDGDHEDWIELYNCSDKDIDLTDWYLSDRYDRPKQWQFPPATIPAKGFLTLWASGKDRADGDELHTNFRIDAAGEPLLLSNADGELVDEILPIAVNAHETVGRYPDGVGDIAILAEPSPGASNTEPIAAAFIDAPEFSHESGFYDKEFTLKLSHPDENVIIYYTLDGSEPDPDNLDGSTYRYKNSYQQPPKEKGQKIEISQDFLYNEYKTHQYNEPIEIKDRTYEPDRISQISTTFDENPDYFPKPEEAEHWVNDVINQTNRGIKELNRFGHRINRLGNRAIRKYYKVTTGEVRPLGDRQFVVKVPEIGYKLRGQKYTFKGTPVRAIAIKENEQRRTMSPIATNTYFIGDREEFSLPIVAITVPEKELFDYDEGVFVAGRSHDEWVEEVGDPDKSPYARNVNWKERMDILGALEVFKDKGRSYELSSPRFRVHGNASRATNLKSFRIYPEDENKGRGLDFDFFEDGKKPGKGRVILRNSGNQVHDYRKTYLADAYRQVLTQGLAFGSQRYKPYIVFVNGEYNGILNARDRLDKFYLDNMYQTGVDNIDLLKRRQIVQHGTDQKWNKFLNYLESPENSGHYFSEVTNMFDINSFADYYAAQIFYGNRDWPGNNIRYWRYQSELNEGAENSTSSTAKDGRWRWIMYDTDASSNDVYANTLAYAASPEPTTNYNPKWSTFVLRSLFKNELIKQYFIIRFADLLNSQFLPDRTLNILNELGENIKNEMPNHIKRWATHKNIADWNKQVNKLAKFMEKRPVIQRQHLQEFFELGDLYTLSLHLLVQGEDGHTEPANKAAVIKLNTLTLGVSDDELEKPVAASARATNMEKYLALPWSGEYFAGMPIKLSAEPRPGYRFSHWVGRGVPEDQKYNSEIELVPDADTSITAVMKIN